MAEFVMVSGLLTVLTIAVLQLGLAMFVRNTVLDAAASGARYAALADRGPADGVARTRALLADTLGPSYAQRVTVVESQRDGVPVVAVTVRSRLPVFGLLGPSRALEVTGRAAVEPTRR